MRRWKEHIVRRILEGYDTDVEPPLTSEDTNTTVKLAIHILCAKNYGSESVSIDAWFRMVCSRGR